MRFPVYILVAPLYFANEIDFGTITQAWVAFFQVFGALSIVTNQIENISAFSASIFRLGNFNNKLNNKNFVDRAPKDVVDNEKKKQKQYESTLKKIQNNLNSLLK